MSRDAALFGLYVGAQASRVLFYAGLPCLFVAVALLAVPASRRSGLRWLAYGLLGFDAACVAVLLGALVPVLLHGWEMRQARRAYDARTHVLSAPQVLAGVAFPAGSTVHLGADGGLESGTVPTPTRIAGLPLVGDFSMDAQGAVGTLAVATTVGGIPCRAGRVWWNKEGTTRCTLERDHPFAGHLLAAGTRIDVAVLSTGVRQLEAGTLARPELLLDVFWPAGTILSGTAAPPERLAHGVPPEGEQIRLCLMPGEVVAIPDATLHGTVTYRAQGNARWLARGCEPFADDHPHDGYVLVEGERYIWGRRPDEASPWRWNNGDGYAPVP